MCSTCKQDQTIITDLVTGEIVCSKFGLIISDKIQDTRQYRKTLLLSRYRQKLLSKFDAQISKIPLLFISN
jgi:hypothetical protein